MRALIESNRVGIEMTSQEFFSSSFGCGTASRATVGEGLFTATVENLQRLGADQNEIVARVIKSGAQEIAMETTSGTVIVWLKPPLRF